ncbi:MAG: hypothetical protein QXU99_05170 [Candidatus Bathyarchaeia archaeon]
MEDSHYGFVLIMDEKYWDRLCMRNKTANGTTHVFVRKNLVGPSKAEKLLFYVKKPIMQICGVADFVERLVGNSNELWQKCGAETCFESFDEYAKFAGGRGKMTFIRFRNFIEVKNPKPTEVVRMTFGALRGFRPRYLNLETTKQLIT